MCGSAELTVSEKQALEGYKQAPVITTPQIEESKPITPTPIVGLKASVKQDAKNMVATSTTDNTQYLATAYLSGALSDLNQCGIFTKTNVLRTLAVILILFGLVLLLTLIGPKPYSIRSIWKKWHKGQPPKGQ